VSPDEGSIKRAVGHANRLGGNLAIIDKRRFGSETRQENVIGGPIEGKIALMFDDMISTAGSICGAAEVIQRWGARQIHVAATHGVFADRAIERLRNAPIDSIVVTDSIPIGPEKLLPNMTVLTVAGILGEAIRRIHQHKSISTMFSEAEQNNRF
jgi:ribose-phosphate pyrophosphokinase